MQVEYKRDMQHNYLVIRDQIQLDSTFQEKMLSYNKLEGILPFQIQMMNGERIIRYEINGCQPLSEVCAKIPPKIGQLSKLVKGLLSAIKQAPEYLLKEDDFLLSLEHIFLELPSYHVQICYYSGYQHSIKSQLAEFFESLMSCVDYEDREAVYLVYSLYMKSREVDCTIDSLMNVLNENSKVPEKQITQEKNISQAKVSDHQITVEKSEEKMKDDFAKVQERNRLCDTEVIEKTPKCEKEKLTQPMSLFPPAMEAAYNPPNQRVEEKNPNYKKTVHARPLISQPRQEEQEVLYYPSKYYIFGGIIVLVVTIVCGAVAGSKMLRDSVTQKLEPIKLAAFLAIVLIPTVYGLIKIFNPKNKISKTISLGLYEPTIQQEMAAAMEYDHNEYLRRRDYENSKYEMGNKIHLETEENHNSIPDAINEEDMEKNHVQEVIPMVSMSHPLNREETHTVLLNGISASPFPQLISEKPEVADSITIMECPFFIGTVKNRMNYSLTSPVISRYHAKIEKIDGAYYLCDLNSTNGTFLNGRRLREEEPNLLVPGDKLSFANICFIFTCPNR